MGQISSTGITSAVLETVAEEFVRKVSKKVSRRRGQLGPAIAQALEGRLLMSTTWTVTTNQDDGSAGSLRFAIDNSAAGDVVNFASNVAGGEFILQGNQFTVTHNLTINGDATNHESINGNNLSRIFLIQSGVSLTISHVNLGHGLVNADGGAVYVNQGALTITDCLLNNNSSGGRGGGIFVQSLGSAKISGCTFKLNQATSDGGAVAAVDSSTLNIDNSEFDTNESSARGGGVFQNLATFTASRSSFIGNIADLGGGIAIASLQTSNDIINCTVGQNQATSGGGGIYSLEAGKITNCTIVDNTCQTASLGGGIDAAGFGVVVKNSIVGRNTAGAGASAVQNQTSGIVTNSGDLVGQGSGGADAGGATFPTLFNVTDFGLTTLGNNGGPTQTYALLPGSPAIDAGGNPLAVDGAGIALATDQRGLARISNSKVDIGAVELQNTVLTAPVVTTFTGVAPEVTWTAIPGATSYNVYRQIFGGTEALLASGVSGTQYFDHTAIAPNSYYYSVRAVAGSQVGPESNQSLCGTFYPGSIIFVNQLGTLGLKEGTSYNLLLAQFPDTSPSPLTTLAGTINWGDGTSSAATFDQNGNYELRGQHTWKTAGTFTLTIHLTDPAGGSDITLTQKQFVLDVPLTAAPTTVTASAGKQFSGVVGSFSDTAGTTDPSNYSTVILWGDGAFSFGTITYNSQTKRFDVSDSHTYASSGTYPLKISVSDAGGSAVNVTSTATVSGVTPPVTSVITATGSNFSATKGTSVSPVLATFTDSHTGQAASHYTASINWGDTTTSAGTIALVNGKFQVSGTHTYSAAGTFTAAINITDPEGGSAAPTSKATVSNPVVIPPGGSVLKGTAVLAAGTKGLPFSGLLLATFTDTKTSLPISAYTATINWGDGTSSSAGVVSFNSTTKLFQVAGAHTYHKAATFNPLISITDTSGGSTVVTGKIYIADSVMHAFPTTFTASAGKPFTGVVGSFTDGDPSDVATDFAATINWGDGHTSAGKVTLNPTTKRFDISGTNTFAVGGTYTVTATPSDVGGMTTAIKSTATVSVIAGPQPKISGATSVKEGSSESISFSATDVGNKAITKWVVDWGDGTVQNLAGTATAASHTYVDGPATRSVKATATDAANLGATASLTVGVLNVAPTATFTGGSSVQPNHTSTVTFSNVHDPSTTDTAAGFRYSFDFNNDSTFEIVNGISATATVPAIYLATLGTKTIHGRVSDKDGGFTDYYTTINVVAQPLTTFGTVIKAVEGTSFTGNIGSFADPSGNTNPAIYSAAINWGDGHTSAGSVAYNATTKRFGVSGANTYALAGSFIIAVQVKSNAGAAGTIQSTASISEAAIAATGSDVSGKEGISLLGVVATFTDANPLAIAGNYAVSINWGDGSAASAGTATFNTSAKKWQVAGAHTYRIGGTYTVTTSISDHGTSLAKATSSAVIAGSTINALGVQLTILNSLLASTPQKIATFTTSNPLLTASDFSAAVDWGDGTTSNPTSTIAIAWDAIAHVFDVMVTHPYSLLLKNYLATITITEGKGASITTATSSIFTN